MEKILSLAQVHGQVVAHRKQGQGSPYVVLANGAFDLLHVGHLRYLQAARALGSCLVVAINDDASVRKAKGASRPVVCAAERAELVAGLACVDWVLVFASATVVPIIETLRPDVHAKGTDYTEDSVPEGEHVRAYGGVVKIVGDAKNHGTTQTLLALQSQSQLQSEPQSIQAKENAR